MPSGELSYPLPVDISFLFFQPSFHHTFHAIIFPLQKLHHLFKMNDLEAAVK
jgi:hypothetical protein